MMRHLLYENLAKKLEQKSSKVLRLGTNTAGIIIDMTKQGIEINGYYKIDDNTTCVNLRKPLSITWEDLKIFEQNTIKSKKQKKKNDFQPKEIKITAEELKKLPITTINDKKYYIDIDNKNIRAVDNPQVAYSLVSLK